MDTLTRTELIVALALTVMFFALAFFASPRKSVPLLFCLIPFQGIENAQSSLNVLLVYALVAAFILRGRLKFLPLPGPILLLLGAYIVSTAFAHPATQMDHAVYLFNFLSAVLLFYVMYNFVREERDTALLVGMLTVTNILVVAYCIAQLSFGRVEFFGIDDLAIGRLRDGDDTRLRGPFFAVGITAEYLVLSILMFAYFAVTSLRATARMGWYVLIGLNLAMLVATANRGGFLVLVGAAGLFLYAFRTQIGIMKALGLATAGAVLLTIASVVILNFSDTSVMFDRLESTELDSGIPDTRITVWTATMPRIQEAPIIGHGPYFYASERPYRGFEPTPWPHNLYLYVLYTVGGVGLLAWLTFFASLLIKMRGALLQPHKDPCLQGLVRLGAIMLIAILVDQIKVEALRMSLVDYWHYLFALFGIWLALADRVKAEIRQPARTSMRASPPLVGVTATSSFQPR